MQKDHKEAKNKFLLIGKDPELSEIVRKHSGHSFADSNNSQSRNSGLQKEQLKKVKNKPVSIFNSSQKKISKQQIASIEKDHIQNETPTPSKENKHKKFFTNSDMRKIKQKRRTSVSSNEINIRRPITPDYQIFEAPKCSNKSKYPRVELFFQTLNMPTEEKYFLHVIEKETKFKYKTIYSKKRNQTFKQTLKTQFKFEMKQVVEVNVWGESNNLLGMIEFELGQLIGSQGNYLIIDLVGGSHGVKVSKNPFVIGFMKAQEKQDMDHISKRPKIKVLYESLKPSVHELEQQKYSKHFLDFLKGNLKIQVIACVDFTASNINSSEPLHAIYNNKLNEYQSAIASICSILLNYDFDKKIPIYGFGAVIQEEGFDHLPPEVSFSYKNLSLNKKKSVKSRLSQQDRSDSRKPSAFLGIVENKVDKRASHFFPLTGDWDNANGDGIEGVFQIYTELLNSNKIRMSSPTLFSPMLDQVNKMTIEGFKEDPYCYTVLLIMTDGVIHDMDETIEKIIEGSVLPLSVIIVGLGCEDFTYMQILDSDDYALKDQYGRVNVRDIIQFVDYSIFNDKEKRFEGLAEEVLLEIPRQVCTFYETQNIKPKVPITTIDNDLKKMFFEDEVDNEYLDIEIKELSEEDVTSNYRNGEYLRNDSGYLGSNSRKNYEYVKIKTSSFGGGNSSRKDIRLKRRGLGSLISNNSQASNGSTNWKYKVPEEGNTDRAQTHNIRKFKEIKLISSLKKVYASRKNNESGLKKI